MYLTERQKAIRIPALKRTDLSTVRPRGTIGFKVQRREGDHVLAPQSYSKAIVVSKSIFKREPRHSSKFSHFYSGWVRVQCSGHSLYIIMGSVFRGPIWGPNPLNTLWIMRSEGTLGYKRKAKQLTMIMYSSLAMVIIFFCHAVFPGVAFDLADVFRIFAQFVGAREMLWPKWETPRVTELGETNKDGWKGL